MVRIHQYLDQSGAPGGGRTFDSPEWLGRVSQVTRTNFEKLEFWHAQSDSVNWRPVSQSFCTMVVIHEWHWKKKISREDRWIDLARILKVDRTDNSPCQLLRARGPSSTVCFDRMMHYLKVSILIYEELQTATQLLWAYYTWVGANNVFPHYMICRFYTHF